MAARKRGPGQPPKGPDGERVSEYPSLLVRIPKATKRQLQALSAIRRVPQWTLVDQAILKYIDTLPEDERQQIDQSRSRRRPLRQFTDERVEPVTCGKCSTEIEIVCRRGTGDADYRLVDCPSCGAHLHPWLPGDILEMRTVAGKVD
jgi:hypothetical protein